MHYVIRAVIVIGMFAVLYYLTNNGYLTVSSKRAVKFVGSWPKKGMRKASFKKCSGFTQNALRPKESKEYIFRLESELTDGTLNVDICNESKRPMMTLNADNPEESLFMEEKGYYYVVVRFNRATGNYTLTWDEE